MSIECGYCERDLRGPHDVDCPRWSSCTCWTMDADVDPECPEHGWIAKARRNAREGVAALSPEIRDAAERSGTMP